MGKGVNEVKEYISEKSIPDVAGHHPLTTVMEYEELPVCELWLFGA